MTSALPILHGPDRPELLRGEVLADLFEATAARLPHKTALIAGGEHLSYGALNAAADLAAHRLILAAVRPGDLVGLWLPRGLELLICQLAIAKTGAAWLPFDAEVPTERIAICLDDANASALLISELSAPAIRAQTGISAQILTAQAVLAPLPAELDVTPYMGSEFFAALKDEDYFKKVTLFFSGIGWPGGGGQDIGPDTISAELINQEHLA